MLHQKKIFRAFLSRRRVKKKIELRMVAMIDVVFLLLIFFLLTANFRSKEGFLPAELPRQVSSAAMTEIEPLSLKLDSQPDGSCRIGIGRDEFLSIRADHINDDFLHLRERLVAVLKSQQRYDTDPIKLMPTVGTSWDLVVRTYDVLWQLNLNNIIFSRAQQ